MQCSASVYLVTPKQDSCSMNVLDVVRCMLGLSCRWYGVLTLWICIVGMVTSERTCGSDFDDIGSSALLASIVVEGRARRLSDGVAQSQSGVIVFDRLRLFKGQLVDSVSEVRSIQVGYFDVIPDNEACVAPLPQLRRSYVLFLHQNDSHTIRASTNISNDARSQHSRRYRLSAFPVRSSRRNINIVLEYTNCSICGRAPIVRLLPDADQLPMQAGQRLELRCRSRRARPSPRIVWSRDGVMLVDGVDRVRISSSRRSRSRLRVERLTEEDAGLYQCQALNAVGQSEKTGIDVVIAADVDPSPTRPHSVICSEHSYCLNGGTCYIMVSLGRRYCICPPGFCGERCQERDVIWEKTRPMLTRGVVGLNTVQTVLLICGVVAAALTVVAVAIIIYASARRCAVERDEVRRRTYDDSQRLLNTAIYCSQQQQQQQARHHERQVGEHVGDNAARDGDADNVVMRHQTTKSNGRVSQPNRSSDGRRPRLKAVSATLESEDLNNIGNLELWRNDVDQSRDNLRPVNGVNSMNVEKETTC